MHDGTFPSMKDALGHYNGSGNLNLHLDKEIQALDFRTFEERSDILVFLGVMTASWSEYLGPPAGLAPN
jgi:hypothetical protein